MHPARAAGGRRAALAPGLMMSVLLHLGCVGAAAARQQVLKAPERERVGINLGWRFHLGELVAPPPACPPPGGRDDFNTSLEGVKCLYGWCGACPGLLPLEQGYASVAACRAACCADSLCGAWQWVHQSDGRNCWSGSSCLDPQSGPAYTNWTGAARALPPDPPAPRAPRAATLGLDDSGWEVVDTPHDFVSYGEFVESGDEVNNNQGNLAKNVSWYRKRFRLPPSWEGRHVELYVEGAYSIATYYFNGELLGTHTNGYTSAIWRLDAVAGAAALRCDGASENVLAIHVDARMARCTGWWYEGGGLFRNSYLISSSHQAWIPSDGVFVTAVVPKGGYVYPATPREGITAPKATVTCHSEIMGPGTATATVSDSDDTAVDVVFTVLDSTGNTVASHTMHAAQLPANVTATLALQNASVWSVARPSLYTLNTRVQTSGGTILDAMNTSFGVRGVAWSATEGLLLNEQRVKMRGFCNHENMGGVGSAIPERVNLFRLQQMRGLGGNAWRASHNPPSPGLLHLADRLGVLFLDENRVFRVGESHNMVDLVRRDRNHASVLWFSFCNEPGCVNVDASAPLEPSRSFKEAVTTYDGTRAVTGNMCLNWGSCPKEGQFLRHDFNASFQMPAILDVQGFSHVTDDVFQAYHRAWPSRPTAATECCSCLSQRGEDGDRTPRVNPKSPGNATVFFSSMNADCVWQQTQWSDSLDFVAGSFVWTLHDYVGEPGGWPHVSSSFGSFDVAGFPKAAVWWYRSWWLANISVADAGRPGLHVPASASSPAPPSAQSAVAAVPSATRKDPTAMFVHIVETPALDTGPRVVHVYSNAPFVRLHAGPDVHDQMQPVPQFGYACFNVSGRSGPEWTAAALAQDGVTVLATHVVARSGAAAALRLGLDAPTPRTGTGNALYLDGVDVALVRAEIVDASGVVVHQCDDHVKFAVLSGPGMLVGTANGNPADHTPIHAATRRTYHGLVRAVVRSSIDGASDQLNGDRDLRKLVNLDAGGGETSASILGSTDMAAVAADVVVQACATGIPCAQLVISTSTNVRDSPFEVAARSVGRADIGS